ncbi:unnamed protein product [Brachionus calyciflorus]|uniref:Uncharacterized protein n=1 Tax=Brachionus calyciflorus TaxID=104777 RepID=A0A814QI21_9BILA|nr:unnamed protein product [Brachionus calyciflorus]
MKFSILSDMNLCESEPNLRARQIFQDEHAKLAKNSSASYVEIARVLLNLTSLKPILEKPNFEQVQSKGCLFHFTQNLMKKLVNCGLKSEYHKNEEFSKWFRSICCLALVPIEKSDQLFEIIMANKPSINGLDKFLDYFVGTYFEGLYTINMWNHFETYDSPRTNNYLEGYNYKLNRHIVISHPDIFRAIDKLKEEEVDLSIKYHKALNKEKAPPRN